jgi:aminocarboxymuconate-semialdehyde decarboxylase
LETIVTIIDVHAHILTDEVVSALAACGSKRPPSFVEAGGGQVYLALGGERKLGPIADGIRRVETHVEDMDRVGIDMQVLAITPIMFGYSEPADVGSAMAQISNDCFLDIAKSQPDRFNIFATLPLQDA